MMLEEDEYHTDYIKCPYCGSEDYDSWEVGTGVFEGDIGIQECGACEKKFTASRNTEVTYNSYKAPCLNGEKQHNWEQMVGAPKEYFVGRFRCSICNKEKREPHKKEESRKVDKRRG